MQPLVIADHLIRTVYGVRLPTDPRGSSSRDVRKKVLANLGERHHGREHVQPAEWAIRQFYDRATRHLQYPINTFDVPVVANIAIAFAPTISAMPYACYGCAIVPDHVHLVARRHRDTAEEMIRTR